MHTRLDFIQVAAHVARHWVPVLCNSIEQRPHVAALYEIMNGPLKCFFQFSMGSSPLAP